MLRMVSLKQAGKKRRRECAKLYCEIWREPPWDEDFWDPEGALKDMDREMKRPGAVGFLALINKKVVGFTWGYAVSQDELCEIGGNALSILFDGSKVFYVDELGVQALYRRKGIGESLSLYLINEAKKKAEIICLRTDQRAYDARSLYAKLGFKDTGIKDQTYDDRTYLVLK